MERLVGPSHIGWNPRSGLLIRQGLQWFVTDGAPGEGALGLQLQIFQHLPDLIVQLFAGDQQGIEPPPPG